MSIKEISEREISQSGVVAMPTRPNASKEFGGRAYTPQQLKEAFDRLPRLIAERLNALIRELAEGEAAPWLGVSLDGGETDLQSALTTLATRVAEAEVRLDTTAPKDRVEDSPIAPPSCQAVKNYVEGYHLTLDPTTYRLSLTDGQGGTNGLYVDLPLEGMVVSGTYDKEARRLCLTLQGGAEIQVPLGDILEGLVTQGDLTDALADKQDTLTMDASPGEGSGNPVTSGGIYEADRAVLESAKAYTDRLNAPIAALQAFEESTRRALCGTVISEVEVEDTYLSRESAGGLEFIDGTQTRVRSVWGNTTLGEDGTATHATLARITSTGQEGDVVSGMTGEPVELGKWDVLLPGEQKIERYTVVYMFKGTESVYQWGTGDTVYGYNVQLPSGKCPLRDMTAKSEYFLCNRYENRPNRVSDGTDSIYLQSQSGNTYAFIQDLAFSPTVDTASYKAHLAELYQKGTPLVIAYKAEEVQDTEGVNWDKGYLAYRGATESIEGNGMPLTVTQSYYVKN